MKDLLKILGDVSTIGYCGQASSTHPYWEWEEKIAAPKLAQLGYRVVGWTTGERDSFGPLSRVVTVETGAGKTERYTYG